MAKRKTQSAVNEFGKAPDKLDDSLFGCIEILDEEQRIFKDALWDQKYKFVGSNSCSGTGKTTLSVAVGVLMCKYRIMDGIYYIRCPLNEERRLGFLPGDLQSKTRSYTIPLINTLIKIGESPYTALDDDTANIKTGSSYITATTDVYLRGDDFSRKFVIVDEAQNATEEQLRTIITRVHDDCCIVVIGSSIQCDMEDKSKSGFVKCLNHFGKQPWAKICNLSVNHRGVVSQYADLPWDESLQNKDF